MLQRLQHAFLGVACVALLFGIPGCSPTDTKRMQALLDQISHGPEDQLGTFIYGYSDASPGAQQVLLGMIRPLRAPSADKHMTNEASRSAGRFTMLSVGVPWSQPTQGYGFQASFQPIIICHDGGRDSVVGYVLPFNDIMFHFHGADMENIMQLSQWWIQTYGKR
ncbi:MAG: hypothetical protein DME22_23995 [Verrucomicrobia bacterium]|nr:MAG: hypothetical protein DME22_23995 [Verrucomicrobiota bacterium]